MALAGGPVTFLGLGPALGPVPLDPGAQLPTGGSPSFSTAHTVTKASAADITGSPLRWVCLGREAQLHSSH